jgi:hypothetical protein
VIDVAEIGINECFIKAPDGKQRLREFLQDGRVLLARRLERNYVLKSRWNTFFRISITKEPHKINAKYGCKNQEYPFYKLL